MLGSVQLSGKAGVSVRADMETGHLKVDQPDDDRAAATAVKRWTFRLPGLVVRHGHGAAATAILLAPGIPPRQHVHSLHLCIFMGPKIRSCVLAPASMVGGGPCDSKNSHQVSGRRPIRH